MAKKILLGAASFGTNYGIANISPPGLEEVRQMLDLARQLGVYGIDTAREYAGSEQSLGLARVENLRVHSKFTHGTDLTEISSMRAQVLSSSRRLMVGHIHAMSPHGVRDYIAAGLSGSRNLERLKDEGAIQQWGLSLYDPSEFEIAINLGLPDFIQIPLNYVDRRFITSGIVERARDLGISIHARSIFLQGALLQSPGQLPVNPKGILPYLGELNLLAKERGVTVSTMLLHESLRDEEIQQVIVGINSIRQLTDLQESLNRNLPNGIVRPKFADDVSLDIIDPRKWSN